MSQIPAPKAAAALIVDAQAAGHTVEVNSWSKGFDVVVRTAKGDLVDLHWSEKNVAPMNSMLGFATTYKSGVRFDYGSAHMAREVWQTGPRGGEQTRYPRVNSVRTARYLLNLSI